MGELLILIVAIVLNVTLAVLAIRLVWWLFKTFVRGTGRAWRDE